MASRKVEGAGATGGGGRSGGARLTDVDITGGVVDGEVEVDLENPGGSGVGIANISGGNAAAASLAGPVGEAGASPAGGARIGFDGDIEAAGGTGDAGAPSPRITRQRPSEGGRLGNPMEGVGEDERAYNYICNLDKVNLGGPGWFNDVFKISVEVDTERTWMDTLSLSLVPRNVFQRHCPLLDASENISGTVTVTAPTSKRVWLSGVSVTFEEYLMTVDSETGELVGALEAQVAAGQFIKDKAVFSFNLDLTLLDGHRRWPVRETYVGDLMALRHRLMVSAHRPWYTFNVYAQIPIAMESLSCAPDEDAGQDNEEGGPNHVLVISDCNGRCEFDFGVDSFNLGDVLQGMVRFMDVTSPIVGAHVMLLRAEFMYGEASEVLVSEHTILGEGRDEKSWRDPLSAAGLSDEERVRRQFMSPFVEQKDIHFVHTEEEDCRIEEVKGDAEISVEIPLHSLPLTPSHMSLTQDIAAINDEAELVGVRYYIRLILEDADQQAYWHTHEIFFHRSDPTPTSDGLDDASSSGSGSDIGYDEGDVAEAEYLETKTTTATTDPASNGHGHESAGVASDVVASDDGRRAGEEDVQEGAAKAPDAQISQAEGAESGLGATAGGTVRVEGMEEGSTVTPDPPASSVQIR